VCVECGLCRRGAVTDAAASAVSGAGEQTIDRLGGLRSGEVEALSQLAPELSIDDL